MKYCWLCGKNDTRLRIFEDENDDAWKVHVCICERHGRKEVEVLKKET